VDLVLDPKMPAGESPTRAVKVGETFDTNDRTFFSLTLEKPADLWCKPNGEVGPAGGMPNVDVPNNDDDGEGWFCRRRRWSELLPRNGYRPHQVG
jgi:hypothetical protein